MSDSEGLAIHALHAIKPQKLAIYSSAPEDEDRRSRRQDMKRRQLIHAAASAIALPGIAFAPSFPTRPVRYICPVSAGGGSDMVARVMCERWGQALGQTFVVENISGGGGVVACQTTMRSAPDGYTLMQGYVATHGTTPAT